MILIKMAEIVITKYGIVMRGGMEVGISPILKQCVWYFWSQLVILKYCNP